MIQATHSESNTTSDNLALHYLVREPKTKGVSRKAIVLLHGVGSNERDLFGLADYLPGDFFIISARGQFSLGADRFAWYNVDFSTGKPVIDPAQELSSRALILKFITQVKQRYNLDEVYLGGFSQGAIMSFSVALTHPTAVEGVLSFSGRILEQNQSEVSANADHQRLKVFLSHGTNDGTLPIHYARQAKTYLEKLHVQLSYHEYNMSHEIAGPVLADVNQWLTDIKH